MSDRIEDSLPDQQGEDEVHWENTRGVVRVQIRDWVLEVAAHSVVITRAGWTDGLRVSRGNGETGAADGMIPPLEISMETRGPQIFDGTVGCELGPWEPVYFGKGESGNRRDLRGKRVRVRDGTLISQDHGFHLWREDGTIFEIVDAWMWGTEEMLILRAPGYGDADAYGCGQIYAAAADCDVLKECEL